MNEKLQSLLRMGVKRSGTFCPDEALVGIEEELTQEEYYTAYNFLDWCWKNDKTFGWNIAEVYAEYQAA